MNAEQRIRVLVAKPGLDGHDRGAKVVIKALQEAGMNAIYSGLRQSVDAILNRAVEEHVDVVGLSILSGSHVPICRELLEKMEHRGIKNIKVVVGGSIPQADVQVLKDLGVAEVFRGGSSFDDIAQGIRRIVKGEETQTASQEE